MNCYMISYPSEFGPEDHGFWEVNDEKARKFFKEFIENKQKESPGTSGALDRLYPATADLPASLARIDYIPPPE